MGELSVAFIRDGWFIMSLYAKKTIEIDIEAIKRARFIFDVKTDKEAVNRALKMVTEEDEIIRTQESLKGKVNLRSVFK